MPSWGNSRNNTGFQAQYKKVHRVRYALLNREDLLTTKQHINICFHLPSPFWLQCINQLSLIKFDGFNTHSHYIYHTGYLALTRFVVTRRIFLSRFSSQTFRYRNGTKKLDRYLRIKCDKIENKKEEKISCYKKEKRTVQNLSQKWP
jgi:hypothetical protein